MIDRKCTQTLFLDRDGVINVERKNDYAKNVSEFIFIDGALEAIAKLSAVYQYIFIVTNQRGVGRGVMTPGDLDEVHRYMLQKIAEYKGRIDKIYVCTDISPASINRKPNTGMAFRARADYPAVDFSRSTMVGNSRSDMEFGNKLGMCTVLVGDKYPAGDEIYKNISTYYPDLWEFTLSLYKNID